MVAKRRAVRGAVLRGGARPRIVAVARERWDKATEDAFFMALAEGCNVSRAAAAAGVSDSAAYRRRRTRAAFRARWAAALSEGYARLELVLLERAMQGVVKEITRPDGSTDVVREYSNQTALALLRMHRDAAHAADSEPEGAELAELRAKIEGKLKRLKAKLAAGAAGVAEASDPHRCD
ncbi:hypothetical protein [Allosphingosinicella indica]|uniref:Uncharacterized protein n=1 Tax=Allosphingosinicella indica TaxID=941907 RepID=A0A1X7GDL6_9SPHN|nr:hypothetical protein [Allosphingosinicella indica]SMF68116.1 hypothetical protein SAMN06295910_1588 [Allosphingosinicella indica]